MKRIIYCLIACLFGIMACHKVNDEPIAEEIHKCVLNLELSIDTYDLNTRGSGDNLVWENGTKLFLNFSNSGNPITGVAEYDASDDSWALSYTGNLNLADKELVSVYFFTAYDTGESLEEIILTPESAIYSDTDGTYSYLDDGELRVIVHLTPSEGRLRFKGDPGNKFTLTNVNYRTGFDIKTQEFVSGNDEVTVTVSREGYSPYIYIDLGPERKLTIYNQYCCFEKVCGDNILRPGSSGFMDVPTQNNYANWNLIPLIPTVETLSPTNVNLISDYATLNGSILGNGGDKVIEYGFLCGTDSQKLKTFKIGEIEKSQFKYDLVASGDSTYYYAAYAVNPQGMAVGELINFKPKSDYPEVQSVNGKDSYWGYTLYGKISKSNNSSIVDYGFLIVEQTTNRQGTREMIHVSIAHNTEHWVYDESIYTKAIKLDIPYEFTYTTNVDDYCYIRWRTYAVNSVGISYGEEQYYYQDSIWEE